jgi:hypothetical protein
MHAVHSEPRSACLVSPKTIKVKSDLPHFLRGENFNTYFAEWEIFLLSAQKKIGDPTCGLTYLLTHSLTELSLS